jgi:hypothetical protein
MARKPWGITDYWLTAEQPVALIATVEKAEALRHFLESQRVFNGDGYLPTRSSLR